MSIIERVADLIGPIARSDRESSPLREEREIPDLDLLEQSLSESQQRPEPPELREVATRPDLKKHTVGSGLRTAQIPVKTSRVLSIDPERLRRQNMIMPDDNRTLIAEAFRRIKRRIILNVDHPKPGTRPNLVMVTSSVPGEGKSFCAINLALSIALEMDHTVLLVDGDVAKPSLPRVLGVETDKGLMDVLLDRQIRLSDVLCRTNIGKLMLLPAGTAHRQATELLASTAMRRVLEELADRYPDRIVIFDSPPLMAASEASVLASHMGQVVIVVEAGKTTEAVLKSALGRIELDNVVGLLLNKGDQSGPAGGYGGYGYEAT